MASEPAGEAGFSPYITFTREDWAHLRASTPLTLSEADLAGLRGINERVSLDEVVEIYLPLSRLLNLHVAARQGLARAADTFLGRPPSRVPYIIGLAGSVSVGKSSAARILQALLARWPDHPRVDLVATDGFLHPNRTLEERGLMGRKGFPESYDLRRLVRFLADLKSGRDEVCAPVYSHLTYDIVPGERQVVRRPDIVVVEGLNVLQTASREDPPQSSRAAQSPAPPASPPQDQRRVPSVFVSDFFDFSIYVDADEEHIKAWYVDRFLTLVRTAFQDPSCYFHRYATLTAEEAARVAERMWNEINLVNLRENIRPTRERARLILRKGEDHAVRSVRLRKL